MIMRKKFVPSYLFSFVVGFVFGELLDVHELWIGILPDSLPWRVVWFLLSYVILSVGIALSNRCGLPIGSDRPFPAGAFRYYKGGLSENQDSVRRDLPGRDRPL